MRYVHPLIKHLTFGTPRRIVRNGEFYVPYFIANPRFGFQVAVDIADRGRAQDLAGRVHVGVGLGAEVHVRVQAGADRLAVVEGGEVIDGRSGQVYCCCVRCSRRVDHSEARMPIARKPTITPSESACGISR